MPQSGILVSDETEDRTFLLYKRVFFIPWNPMESKIFEQFAISFIMTHESRFKLWRCWDLLGCRFQAAKAKARDSSEAGAIDILWILMISWVNKLNKLWSQHLGSSVPGRGAMIVPWIQWFSGVHFQCWPSPGRRRSLRRRMVKWKRRPKM